MSETRSSRGRWNLVTTANLTWASLFVLWCTVAPQAQEMPVPVDAQLALFAKILTFDRELSARAGDEIVVGILYQKKFRLSLTIKNEFMGAMASVKELADIRSRCVAIDISDSKDLAGAVSGHGVDVLYVAPIRAVEIKKIAALSRARQMTTLTGVPGYVESGLAVGIGTKGGKPRIIINLPAAKAEGIDFKSRLLKLAKIVE